WAVPIGVLGGLAGALFGALLLGFSRRCAPLLRSRPLALGLAVGGLLSLLLLLSGGASGGDGERLMQTFLQSAPYAAPNGGPQAVAPELALLGMRLLGPVLALGVGIPGGLIDPAFAFGAMLGRLCGGLAGMGGLGTALGMAAGLAGATQLPVATVLFALRLAADQQLLPGLLVAAVLAAYVSRLLLPQPLYHALRQITIPSIR
ncbi:MAG: chloride channel protein, partial [Synechococcaceae cyanobacterium]